ncbi:unnamed protein product [Bursaphelenchus xylophilus]|uniref:glucuronosyltransferase n=2 Tax=Bursaphelenchus xylophilus TaxID=6326 RepID=A0A7I8XIT5_BURXY|nr:unnamed protein product [Bursaphelenchus xylophilus]CAG9125286.1 unnamed protein product [Bursaphelenchus xylophilus]
MSKLLMIFLSFLTLIEHSGGYKILVWSPTISKSHMIQNGRLADALAKDGHNVTVLETDVVELPGSLKVVKHANLWTETFDWPERERILSKNLDLLSYGVLNGIGHMDAINRKSGESCLALLRDRRIIQKIAAEKFDVIIFGQFDVCPFVIAHMLNISVKIWMSSCPIIEHQATLVGIPAEFSYVPAAINGFTGDRMTIIERFWNIVKRFGQSYSYLKYWDEFYAKLKLEYDGDITHPIDLAKTTDLVFINTDELLDFPRPLPPNVIHIGGFGMDKVDTTLTKEYEALMSEGKEGIVYFSFGSIVPTNSLPQTYRKNIIDSFGRLKDYFFIMKISENDKFSAGYAKGFKNVFISSWAPQTAILAHPRTKLFITHGGYNSIMEASRFSVPLLLIGMFSDQPRNSKLVERNGWGLSLDKRSLLYGTEEFEGRIQELLTNLTYKQNAIRITNLAKTKPQTGEQRLLSYVRFLESNGGHLPELKTIASDLSLIEYLNLDVLAATLLFIILIAATVVYVIRKTLPIVVNVAKRKIE